MIRSIFYMHANWSKDMKLDDFDAIARAAFCHHKTYCVSEVWGDIPDGLTFMQEYTKSPDEIKKLEYGVKYTAVLNITETSVLYAMFTKVTNAEVLSYLITLSYDTKTQIVNSIANTYVADGAVTNKLFTNREIEAESVRIQKLLKNVTEIYDICCVMFNECLNCLDSKTAVITRPIVVELSASVVS